MITDIHDLLDREFTLHLQTLNAKMQSDLFIKILQKIYVLIIQELEHMVCPMKRDPDGSRPTPLSPLQSILLQMALDVIFGYFHGGGQGVAEEQRKTAERLLQQLFKLHKASTERILTYYQSKFGDDPQAHVHSGLLRPQHIIQIVSVRRSYDDMAKQFCDGKLERKILDDVFRSNNPGGGSISGQDEELIMTINKTCMGDIFHYGVLHLYSNHLCFESNKPSRKNNSFAIQLKDIDNIKHTYKLFVRGFRLSHSGKKTYFYFHTKKELESVIDALTEPGKIKASGASPDDFPFIPRHEAEESDDDSDDDTAATLGKGGFLSSEIDDETDRLRFGLSSEEHLVDQMRCALSRENEGFLFVFTNYLCFESLMGQSDQIIYFGDMLMVEKKKQVGKSGRILIVFKDSERDHVEFRRFAALKRAHKIISGQLLAYEKLNSGRQYTHSRMESNSSSTMSSKMSIDSPISPMDTSVTRTMSIHSNSPITNISGTSNLSDRIKNYQQHTGTTGNKIGDKKLDKYSKRQRHFFAHFNLDPSHERFFIGTKADRTMGKGKNYGGRLYLSNRHICFEPKDPSRAEAVQCVIDLVDVSSCEPRKKKKGFTHKLMTRGNSMQILLKNGQCHVFWIYKFDEVIQIIKSEGLARTLNA